MKKCIICGEEIQNKYTMCKNHYYECIEIKYFLQNLNKQEKLNLYKEFKNIFFNKETTTSNSIKTIFYTLMEENENIDNISNMFKKYNELLEEEYFMEDEEIENSIKNIFKNLEILKSEHNSNYRLNHIAQYRANDGHYVRSQGELLIDNWLYENNILHEYEHKLFINEEEFIPDFYIKQKKIYIEYIGIQNNKKYDYKTDLKEKIYKKNKINFQFLYPEDLKNLQDILEKLILN